MINFMSGKTCEMKTWYSLRHNVQLGKVEKEAARLVRMSICATKRSELIDALEQSVDDVDDKSLIGAGVCVFKSRLATLCLLSSLIVPDYAFGCLLTMDGTKLFPRLAT